MNKSFKLKSIGLLFAMGAMSNVSAEVDDQVLVVTANRTEQNINDVLAAVEIITRQDIEKIQPESITDLLVTIAGFDIAFSGGAGQVSSLFTRGTNSDHTLILIDGVRVGSATNGVKSFSTIPVAQIERIEIVKGPRAALWGSDAVGGVIQIFTRRLNTGEITAEVTSGSNSFSAANIAVGFGNEAISNTLTISSEVSEGFDVLDDSSEFAPNSEVDDDGYRRLSIALRGDYKLSSDSTFDWLTQIDKGNNEFDNAWGGNESDYDNYLWNLRYSYHNDQWLTQFSFNQSQDESVTYGNGIGKAQGTVFATTRDQINLFTQYQATENLSFAGGFEQYEDNISDTKNITFDQTLSHAEKERTTESVFVTGTFNSDLLIAELSARYDDIELIDSNRTFNLSLGYHLSDNFIVSASRSKGFKAPTFDELYFPTTMFFHGNPDLVAEESYNTELLFKGHWGEQSITVVSYQNNVGNLISYDAVQQQSINIDNAELSGQEVVYQYRGEMLSHKLSASHVQAKDMSIDPNTNEARNEQLQRRAKSHFAYELSLDWEAFTFFTQVNYTGKRPDNDYSTWPATRILLDSYTQINLGATYEFNEVLKFKLKVSDVTDEAPQTVLTYNAAGRQIFFGVQYLNF